ncbi:MAG: ribonuclease T2-like [Geoglossum umbratile]|nr:MAG: ribonuclease T2-like [Geoglossum umbratile]
MSFPSPPSVQALLKGFAAACVGHSSIFGLQQAPEVAPLDTCPLPELSCHGKSPVNACCTLAPGGQILQTQFWDTDPTVGPSDSPNYCDHGYPESCDPQRNYDIRDVLESYGEQNLIDYMSDYMKPNDGTDDNFWNHEWSKHGTCMSTMQPKCYGANYKSGEEVPVYFQKLVDLFKQLDTYQFLEAAGITPSKSRQVTRSEVQAALKDATGFDATIRCKNGRLQEAYYHFNVIGTLQEGKFVQTNPISNEGNCPKKFKYLPKH